jgi:uncharacterized protein DUF5752
MKTATQPFLFSTAGYLVRIANQKAGSIAELADGVAECSDASIFHHTFQTLGQHHFLTEGFSNDFAQWVLTSANRVELAEQLAALDVRDYLSLAEVRSDLHRVLKDYADSHPGAAEQTALEPFYFCESVEIAMPLGEQAASLEDFRHCLEHLSHASLYYHFIASRLRLQLRTNDFSVWFANDLGLTRLADRTNRVDIYANTLDSARRTLLSLVDRELAA